MARTSAISLIGSGAMKAELAELYGYVIENVQKETLSSALKSQDFTGNPAAGSVEYRRFVNSTSKEYGTARAAGKGDLVKAPPVTVNLGNHREIVEEMAKFDMDSFGVGDIVARRTGNHVNSMVSELETAFFAEACSKGTQFTPQASAMEEVLEELIQTLEMVKNEFVYGVNRNIMNLVCNTAFYGKLRDLLDTKPNPGVDTAAESFALYHGVKVHSSIYLPAGKKVVLMIEEAVAQPVVSYPYTEPEKIPLSNDYATQLFYDYGTKVLTPDLVFVY